MHPTTLHLILGDQLNISHSWFIKPNDQVHYVLMEIRPESEYVHHHIQKLVLFFVAMRQFAAALQKMGHQILYIRMDDPQNTHSFEGNLMAYLDAHPSITRFEYQEPDEYRLDVLLADLAHRLPVKESRMVSSEHFYTDRSFLKQLFKDKKTYLMERFYREMRQKHQVMLRDNEPEGGKWNYDAENRVGFSDERPVPPIPTFHEPMLQEVVQMIHQEKLPFIGSIDVTQFYWPVHRKQAKVLLKHFLEEALPWFGTWQDAMHTDHVWMFHSRLSAAMNLKMISPKEVIDAAVATWRAHPEQISINQIEGFVRQILGWREYMRGIYWAEMPSFATKNFFQHERTLPSWFWTGKTKMNCMRHAIVQSLHHSYAHHIQRLMITGNFALLAGIHPDEVDRWYLGIYIDAIEWVEITNTRGMSQFADGGIVGTKPYVSSGNYIHKMSNYCEKCQYKVKEKTGARACPFNSLYWHFYARNADVLERNPRIGMMYRTWAKMEPSQKKALLDQADSYLRDIESL